MDKRQLIEAIRQINSHAEVTFLEQFEAADLAEYLNRLEQASTRNIRLAGWARPARRELRMVS